jgi:hypothetical protein
MVALSIQNVSTDIDFFKSGPKKCQILGQEQILKKFIGRPRLQWPVLPDLTNSLFQEDNKTPKLIINMSKSRILTSLAGKDYQRINTR